MQPTALELEGSGSSGSVVVKAVAQAITPTGIISLCATAWRVDCWITCLLRAPEKQYCELVGTAFKTSSNCGRGRSTPHPQFVWAESGVYNIQLDKSDKLIRWLQ